MAGSVVDGGKVVVAVSEGAAGSVVVGDAVVDGADVGVVGEVGVCLVPPDPFVWSART